eukprot:TRINITY_DN447_c0_g1_i1.p1 TRINITY_DN447_c0_g1~~TRINITY_DN447_c0_g1_i1.p1  ORF type:complete len:654 (+),score=69.16 TRINITY_DN447_c0_g1_i1:72-1964(+)
MAHFRMWLHPEHGLVDDGLHPCPVRALEHAPTVSQRLSILVNIAADTIKGLDEQPTSKLEVFYNDLGLYAQTACAERCFWLPLTLSQLVESTEVIPGSAAERDGVVGVIIYSYPMESCALSWGRAQRRFEQYERYHVWKLVVSRNGLDKRKPAPNVMSEAMEVLGIRGAIRSNFDGFERLDQTLGRGSFATVFLMRRQIEVGGLALTSMSAYPNDAPLAESGVNSNSIYAAKVMLPTVSDESAQVECSYLLAAQPHPNVARFLGIMCELSTVKEPVWTLLMEGYPGGSINSRVREYGAYSECDALRKIGGLLEALCHIHALNIIHRDVKPVNVLLATDGRAVLVDFGVAVHITETKKMTQRCGSPGCIAPEMLRAHAHGATYGKNVDVFSSGVVLYYCLSGLMPFLAAELLATLRINAKAQVSYPSDVFRATSSTVKDLVQLMLQAQPQRRPCSRSALEAVNTILATYRLPVAEHTAAHSGSEASHTSNVNAAELAPSSTVTAAVARRDISPVTLRDIVLGADSSIPIREQTNSTGDDAGQSSARCFRCRDVVDTGGRTQDKEEDGNKCRKSLPTMQNQQTLRSTKTSSFVVDRFKNAMNYLRRSGGSVTNAEFESELAHSARKCASDDC